eukprot:TRINITY_DN2729_c1_g2_i4.p1 TRINITY_DN2729_c1_g2~~TRINITY_DN2729_c1_g2_i4.p1  ORF type:complete len:346 (+),score=94.05 TRINITY_DN2729_c1_g2_i4:516-1553(+)
MEPGEIVCEDRVEKRSRTSGRESGEEKSKYYDERGSKRRKLSDDTSLSKERRHKHGDSKDSESHKREREREREKDREKDRKRDKERERDRDRDRDREREKPRERKELDSKDRPTSADKPNDSFRYDDFTIEETTVVENPTLSYKESLKRTRDEHSPISNKSRRTGLPAPNSRREEYEMPLRHQDKPDDVVFTVKLSSSMLDPKDTQKKSFPSKPARPPRAPNGRYKNLSLVLYNPTSSPDKPEAKPSVATTKAPKPPPKSRSSAPNTKPNAKPPTTSQTKKDEKSLPPKRLARPIKKAYIEPSPVTWISKSLSVDSPLPDLTVSRNGNMVWRPEDVIAKHQENKV